MQRNRVSLVASTLFTALALSGVAAAHGGTTQQPPAAQGGVPHAGSSAADNTQTAPRPRAAADQRTLEMQRALAARNLYNGKIDGVWGAKTESALRNFQSQNNLTVTGRLDEPTAEKLGLQTELQPVAGTEPPTTAPVARMTPEVASTNVQINTLSQEQIKEMQQRLQLLGYYKGPIDGTAGEGTRSALQQFFQRQAQLAANGQVSNATIGLFGTEPSDVK
jgi:peptidoglycan hydrolase-like protein with peptidoglycan-binding domain